MRMIVELHAAPTQCEPQAFTFDALSSMARIHIPFDHPSPTRAPEPQPDASGFTVECRHEPLSSVESTVVACALSAEHTSRRVL